MAKISSRLRNEKRKQLVAQYADQRAALKAVIKSKVSSDKDKQDAQSTLNGLPKNSSPVRVRNRCEISGRVRGYLRRFLPNIQRKRYFLPDENRWITLSVSAHGMKIIDKKGLVRVVAEMRAAGEKI